MSQKACAESVRFGCGKTLDCVSHLEPCRAIMSIFILVNDQLIYILSELVFCIMNLILRVKINDFFLL